MMTRATGSPLARFRYISGDKFGFKPHLIRLVTRWTSPGNRSPKLGTSRDSFSLQDSHRTQMASSLSHPLTASGARMAQVTSALLLTGVICFSFVTLQAQKVTGTVSGTVVDNSGAVVSGANIVVTNTNTGVVIFNTTTDETGTYRVPAVQPGTYSIAVSHSGFKTDVRSGVVIEVNQNGVVDFTLQVGETSQEVEVTAAAPLLVTQSAALSNVVGEKAVSSLPLNGRFFTELVSLTPGVAPASTGAGVTQNPNGNTFLGARSGWPGAETNGQRPGSNNYTINGIDNEESTVASIILYPPVDAIQEFRIQTTNQDAQFGKNPGATINVATKSGGNAFHGEVYEFIRNSALDASNYFDLPGLKPPFKLNQYGAILGGPIQKNKTFFFGYWEGDKIDQGQTNTDTVPTAAEKLGDFSGTSTPIFDPNTLNPVTGLKQQFPGNVIPSGRLSAPALQLDALQASPPNKPGLVNNFVWNPARISNDNSFGVRIDHQLRVKDNLFGSFIFQNFTLADPSQLSLPILPAPQLGIPHEITTVTETLNTRGLQIGETHAFTSTLVSDFVFGFSREYVDIPNPLHDTVNLSTNIGIPNVNNSSIPFTQGLSSFSIGGYTSLGEPTTPPFIVADNNFEVVENMSWNKGKHDLEFGGDLIRRQYNFFQSPGQRGTFSFPGTYTSQLGVSGTGNGFADFLLGIPATSTLAVFSNLVGQRQWESGYYFQDTWHVTPKLNLTLGVRYELLTPRAEVLNRQGNFDPLISGGAVVLASDSAPCGRALRCIDRDDIGPRIALAYVVNNKTAVRSGFGVFYDDYAVNGFGGFTTGLMLAPPFYRGTSIINSITTPTNTLSTGVPPVPLSSIPIVNGYVYPQPGTLYSADYQDPHGKNAYVEEYNLTVEREVGANGIASVSYVGNQSHRNQYTGNINQATPGPGAVASRRPFPGWPDINSMLMNAQGSFNSLQASFQQRASHGLSFLASYTYSHAIDDAVGEFGGVQQTSDLRGNMGNSSWDLRQNFSLSGNYQLPFGSNLHGIGETLVAGWAVNGIYTALSGSPFSPSLTSPVANTGTFSRPNRVCNGTLSHRTVNQWFNTSCFTTPPLYQFGNSGRNILFGPGTDTLNFSAFKNTYISENRSRYFQFRAEFFNIFNKPQFNNPNSTIGSPVAGTISSAGDPASFTRTSRQIQFALKFYF
jgi:hypothetical protein